MLKKGPAVPPGVVAIAMAAALAILGFYTWRLLRPPSGDMSVSPREAAKRYQQMLKDTGPPYRPPGASR